VTAAGDAAPRIRRVLVALDASADSQAALLGLFVEDADLARLAGSPLSAEIDFLSGERRPLAPAHLERQLRARAARARQALEREAARRRLAWTFRTARGRVSAEILAADADLITLGHRGHSPRRGPGSTVQALLAGAGAPVLVSRRGVGLGRSVFALDDGSPAARRALVLAAELAHRHRLPWTHLVVPANEAPAEGEARSRELPAGEAGGEVAGGAPRTLSLATLDAAGLAAVAAREGCGLLVLPRDGATLGPDGVSRLLRLARCPLLLVG
jgi:nucleotide-binding universal stress UspA family protein